MDGSGVKVFVDHGFSRGTAEDTQPRIAMRDVVTMRYEVRAPPSSVYPGPIRHLADTESPVRGVLVGVTDGRSWGWWGPVSRDMASAVRYLWRHRPKGMDLESKTPSALAAALADTRRHGHTGIYSAASGAIELALWDLAGASNNEPVWRFFSDRLSWPPPSCYATGFGIPVDESMPPIALSLGETWGVIKLRATDFAACEDGHHLLERVVQESRWHGIALDYLGRGTVISVRLLCASVADALAWVEEPLSPVDATPLSCLLPGTPIAAGEHCYNPREVQDMINSGVEVCQPDAVFCGGFRNLRKGIKIIKDRGLTCAPHGGGFLPACHTHMLDGGVDLLEYHLLLEPRRQAHLAAPVLSDPNSGVCSELSDAPGWAGPLNSELTMGSEG